MMIPIHFANGLVAQQLELVALQHLKDLEVLQRVLPTTFLPALVQEALQVIRDSGQLELLHSAVIEVDRFLRLAAKEVKELDQAAGNLMRPAPSPYRIFRRLLHLRAQALERAKAAMHEGATITLTGDTVDG